MNYMKSTTSIVGVVLLSSFFIFFPSCQTIADPPFKNNAVATAHPLATTAGEKMLTAGGNAFDAAVAAAFALAVVEPSMSGLGGRLQALYRTAGGDVQGVDATTVVPERYTPTKERYRYGYETIGIPGVVAGLLQLLETGGTLPLEMVMAPAIQYAREGFSLLPGEAQRHAMVEEQLAEFEGTRQYFLTADGTTLPAGTTLVQKDLARVLTRIAQEGRKGFYEGETAKKIVEDVQANGGILTLNDLKNYTVNTSRIVQGKYKGYDIYGLYLPSFGAITIQMLQILDALTLDVVSDSRWASQVGKSIATAYAYRQYQKDEDSLKEILSYQRAQQWAKDIIAPTKKVAFQKGPLPESWGIAQGHTTHLTVADSAGNVVSLTQTVGPIMGSKVVSPGLGFVYAVTLGGYLGNYQPGDRAASHISPVLFMKNNTPVLALGAAGGSRIPIAIAQVAQRYLEQNSSLDEALAAPRVYIDKDTLLLEKHEGINWFSTPDAFEGMALPYKWISGQGRFGRVHAVALDTLTKQWKGAADPDWEGTAID